MKKGFTLVELIGVLVILSIIALIVTPNILVSVKEYQKQSYENNLEAIKNAAQAWVGDNINEVPVESNMALIIPVKDLVDGGYIDEKITDPVNNGYFDDEEHDTFVVVECVVLEDELGLVETNYKYNYEAYPNKEEYVIAKAIKYAKDNELRGDTVITTVTLRDEGYIREHLLYKGWEGTANPEELTMSNMINIEATATGKNGNVYEYTITLD